MFKKNLALIVCFLTFFAGLSGMEGQQPDDYKRDREHTAESDRLEPVNKKQCTSGVETNQPEISAEPVRLIELGEIADQVIAHEDYGGEKHDGKEYLNTSKEERLLFASFEELIKEKNDRGLSFILAVVTTKTKGIYTHTYYAADGLNQYLFDNYKFNRYEDCGRRSFKDPCLALPIVGEIRYFTIGEGDGKARFLCTDYDLCFDSSKTLHQLFFRANKECQPADIVKLVEYYFKANQPNAATNNAKILALRCDKTASNLLVPLFVEHGHFNSIGYLLQVAELAEDRNNKKTLIEQAKNDDIDAYRKLASYLYCKGKIQKAKKWLLIAIGRYEDIQSNIALANLFSKEENYEEAKKCTDIYAQGDYPQAYEIRAQALLGLGQVDQAKEVIQQAIKRWDMVTYKDKLTGILALFKRFSESD